jgi:pimeloyl-ACP methyl ester carboxylesterase
MPQVIAHDGARLVFDESGDGKQSVVLLHGMACERAHMAALAEHLSPRFRCINLDVRGHGESDKPIDAYTMHDFHADLDTLVHARALGRPIVIGHSFGGSIGLAYAHRDPSRVRALVMLDSGMRSNATVTADLGPFYAALREGDYEATLHEFVRARLVDPVDGEAFARTIAAGMAAVPMHVFLSMSDTVQQLQSAEMARELTSIPALFVSSRQAFADPGSLAALGPNWHKGQVVGAGHFVQLIAPDQVHAMIDRFVELERLET